MVTIDLSTKSVTEQKTNVYVLLVPQDFSSTLFKEYEKKLDTSFSDYLKQQKFEGKQGQVVVLPIVNQKKIYTLIFIGIGKAHGSKHMPIESLRRALGTLYKRVTALKERSFAFELPAASLYGCSMHELAQQMATALHITSYRFNDYFSDKDKKEFEIDTITLCADAKDTKEAKAGIADAVIIAQAVNQARHWIDSPPSDMTPVHIADHARAIAKKAGLKITVFDEKEVIKMGMGGLAGVARGSDVDCQLIILEYKTTKKNAPTIAFVGKGITFDSGGLSIKPAASMETMKEDMSGAAAVINTMQALAYLKPEVNVIGITPTSENLPSGKATKPGDILTFYNGKTAEVKNTDAEGRLILADALSYAVKHYKPDAIIDIATLTGACAAALGPMYTGLLSENNNLVDTIEKSAQRSGDHVWRLPLSDDYAPAIKSDVADISNIGNSKYMAGATTAALFLKHFVDDVPWAHLDIAGTAFNVPDRPYYRTGATGVGVRLLVDIAMHWK